MSNKKKKILTSNSHIYLSLPLIPEDEFLQLFPEHTASNAHELMIARIKHEHDEREKLEQARQELLKRKQALIAENKKRKDDLANLDADLERFIDVCFFSLPRFVVGPRQLVFDTNHLMFLNRLQNRFRRLSKRNIDSC